MDRIDRLTSFFNHINCILFFISYKINFAALSCRFQFSLLKFMLLLCFFLYSFNFRLIGKMCAVFHCVTLPIKRLLICFLFISFFFTKKSLHILFGLRVCMCVFNHTCCFTLSALFFIDFHFNFPYL